MIYIKLICNNCKEEWEIDNGEDWVCPEGCGYGEDVMFLEAREETLKPKIN